MYGFYKVIIESSAKEELKEMLGSAFEHNKVVLLRNGEYYRGWGKTTLIKNLSDNFNFLVYTKSKKIQYDPEKNITKIEQLIGRERGYILIDYEVYNEEAGKKIIKDIRNKGMIPIGFISVFDTNSQCDLI